MRIPSWIVPFWSFVFFWLGRISIFTVIRAFARKTSMEAGFVEIWVFANSGLSIGALAIVTQFSVANWLSWVIFAYAIIRIIEVFVYQINVLLFDEYRARKSARAYAVHGYRRLVILLIHNYFELVCWFGVLYVHFYQSGSLSVGPGQPDPTFYSVFRDSLLLMFSFTADRYHPASDFGLFLFSVHATVGIFMTVLVFARFLALLPNPTSKDPMEAAASTAPAASSINAAQTAKPPAPPRRRSARDSKR